MQCGFGFVLSFDALWWMRVDGGVSYGFSLDRCVVVISPGYDLIVLQWWFKLYD